MSTESEYKRELRGRVWIRQRGVCAVCHKPMQTRDKHGNVSTDYELAHIVAKGKLAPYGWRVTWSPLVVVGTHHACNSRALIGNKGLREDEIVKNAIEEADHD